MKPTKPLILRMDMGSNHRIESDSTSTEQEHTDVIYFVCGAVWVYDSEIPHVAGQWEADPDCILNWFYNKQDALNFANKTTLCSESLSTVDLALDCEI
jgi:hypothetical protein